MHASPLLGTVQKFKAILLAYRGEILLIANAAIADKPLQETILVGIEKAKKMNAVLGNGFEAAKCKQACRTGSFHQADGLLNPVMVGDADDLDSGFLASCDDRGVVLLLSLELGLLVVPGQVGEGVYLQGASVEARAVRKFEAGPQAGRESRACLCLAVRYTGLHGFKLPSPLLNQAH
jgi:hypothetical protein